MPYTSLPESGSGWWRKGAQTACTAERSRTVELSKVGETWGKEGTEYIRVLYLWGPGSATLANKRPIELHLPEGMTFWLLQSLALYTKPGIMVCTEYIDSGILVCRGLTSSLDALARQGSCGDYEISWHRLHVYGSGPGIGLSSTQQAPKEVLRSVFVCYWCRGLPRRSRLEEHDAGEVPGNTL